MSFEKLYEALADLPVASIAEDVVTSVLRGSVTALSSATGSGKTLYQTTKLADSLDEQVVVLVPRRFLAVNAAETVAELSGCEVGKEVGYAVGSQSGDRSCWGPETKLVFATHGYALASGLVQKATTFVLDEVHETSMDLSIVRALLLRRLDQGESLNLLEMSATMDSRRQSAYWGQVAPTKVFEIDGKTFDCDVRHRPAGNLEEQVIELIQEGRRGILVFRPGVGEVEDTAEKITALAIDQGLEIEVAQIYGEMSYVDRRAAAAAPAAGKTKVLVSTNVTESGANIPWLDAGVSCGTGKENSVRAGTGATYLELVNLPQWRLQQQEGRVKRFCPGVFVLCSPLSFEQREQATRPEIERLALTELVLHCTSFGLRTHELTFDYPPNPEKVMEAELKLERLGLVDKNCTLTDAGKWIADLPVGPETGAMLWHARVTECLAAMIPLAAIVEVGGLRKEFRQGHYKDSTSDYLDSLYAFRHAYDARGKERREVMERYNIGFKRFEAALDLIRDLERRLSVVMNLDFEQSDHRTRLRHCLLAGSLDKLFKGYGRGDVLSIKNRYDSYRIGQGSAVYGVEYDALVAGDLRVITPKDRYKTPFTILEKVTVFAPDDLEAVAKIRPEILVESKHSGEGFGSESADYLTLKLFGEYIIRQTRVRPREERIEEESLGQLLARAVAARH